MNKLHDLIISAIQDKNSPPWFPQLTQELVNYGWQQLFESHGLTRNNYSTDAVLNKRLPPSLNKPIVSVKPSAGVLTSMNIYPTPDKIAAMYADSGAKPYTADELQNSTVLQCLQQALDILAEIPTVYETVSCLTASLHLIKPEDDEFDISFSLPDIPFSIFVSVPSKRMDNDALRVAEAILHEAMHLQLTLLEQCVPLIIETDEKYFSPWKNEYRHPRGVLHAIYVFRVIHDFFDIIKNENSTIYLSYISNRCNKIILEMTEVSYILNCPYFTNHGQLILINTLSERSTAVSYLKILAKYPLFFCK